MDKLFNPRSRNLRSRNPRNRNLHSPNPRSHNLHTRNLRIRNLCSQPPISRRSRTVRLDFQPLLSGSQKPRMNYPVHDNTIQNSFDGYCGRTCGGKRH
jgi:hypothetical protein